MIANIIESGREGAAGGSPSAETTMRALVVDDHAIVRLGLRQLIQNGYRGAIVNEAESGDKALEMVRKQAWDIVLLDLTMPGCSGVEVLKGLNQLRPRMPVLVFSMHPEDHFAIRVLKEGAAGYITKNSGSDEILLAIKKALAGQKYVSSALAEKLALNLGGKADGQPHELLSTRETEVMRMLGTGKSVKEISFELGLSARTVSTYRARLLEKMQLVSNADIVRYALLNHLIE